MRFATVPPMRPSPATALAPIRTKFALPCAFAVITLCTLATAPVARSAEPAVARAVFVTPAGDRAEAQRAVVSAGGIPEAGWAAGSRPRCRARSSRRCAARPPWRPPRSPRRPRPTPIISQGVALSGADAPAALGARRQRHHDRRARPGLRRGQPAERAGGHASSRRSSASTAQTFDVTYGLAGRDFNANSSRHGEFVSEIVYDMAPARDLLVPQLPHARRVRPGRRLHRRTRSSRTSSCTRTRSCSAASTAPAGSRRRSTQAAAAGILWVNSAGNYRTRHWEGAWSDADGDGNLDVPGDGNAFRFELAATNRPACDISWAGATSDPGSYYSMALYSDPGADDAGARQEHAACRSSPTGLSALPDPHADMPPGSSPRPGPTTWRSGAIGTPPTTNLTHLLPHGPGADARRSPPRAPPRPGDATGALLGRRLRRHHAAARVVLLRGTDRRRSPQARASRRPRTC